MAQTQMDATVWLILVFLLILLVILGYMYHNDWDTQAAGKEAERHAKYATAEMKKGAYAAAVQVEKATRPKEGDQSVAESAWDKEPSFGFPKHVDAAAEAPAKDHKQHHHHHHDREDAGTGRLSRNACC